MNVDVFTFQKALVNNVLLAPIASISALQYVSNVIVRMCLSPDSMFGEDSSGIMNFGEKLIKLKGEI